VLVSRPAMNVISDKIGIHVWRYIYSELPIFESSSGLENCAANDGENGQLAVENHHLNPYKIHMLEVIDYLVFYVPLKNIQLVWRFEWSLPMKGCQFRPMLSAQGLWAGPGEIFIVPHLLQYVWDLSFSGLIRRTAPINCLLRLATESFNAEDLFLSESSQAPIQLPLATCKGVLRIYSYPDSRGFIPA
jgi:hypothetical protein